MWFLNTAQIFIFERNEYYVQTQEYKILAPKISIDKKIEYMVLLFLHYAFPKEIPTLIIELPL